MENKKMPAGITRCETYEHDQVKRAMEKLLNDIHGLDWLTPGMTVAIKTNLVSAAAPEKAVVTHPVVLAVLTEILKERGADVVIGDSPGGLFTTGALEHAYRLSGLQMVEQAGASLNLDVSSQEVQHPQGKVLHSFTCTSWLLKADAIIDCCKLKTHGMMAMSANVKNMFGVIPGTMKPEYHFRFPKHEDFADMLVDLNTCLQPKLYLTDAIVGMEGNGPTSGTPRQIGALLASKDPYGLDLLCAHLIGLSPEQVPTIMAAVRRDLSGLSIADLQICGDYQSLVVPDYQNITKLDSIEFSSVVPKCALPFVRKVLKARPVPDKEHCIGCEKCRQICPAKAITMKEKKPVIDTGKCIRCFCCQEFCPVGAMKVHRSWLARRLS